MNWRHDSLHSDTRHNDTRYNDTRHSGLQHNNTLDESHYVHVQVFIMLSVTFNDFVLIVIMPSAVILNVVMLNVMAPAN